MIQEKDTPSCISKASNLMADYIALSREMYFKSFELIVLKNELESEKHLHNYYKDLYINLLNNEVEQCWN